MITEGDGQESVERAPRVEMRDGRHGGVVIERSTAQGPSTIGGRLVDISRGGAKLALDTCVPFGETVSLCVAVAEINLHFQVQAEISWSRQGEGGTWLVGCCFNPSLPDETVDRLARSGYLERRRSPRYPISIGGTVRWELSAAVDPVCLADLSLDGFSMLCAKAKAPGQRFRLELDDDNGQTTAVAGKTQWQAETEDGHLIGCSLMNRQDFHRVWELVHQTEPNQPLRSRVSLPQSRWLLAWFAALVAFIILYPPVVRLLEYRESVASEWDTPAAAGPLASDTNHPSDAPSQQTSLTPAGPSPSATAVVGPGRPLAAEPRPPSQRPRDVESVSGPAVTDALSASQRADVAVWESARRRQQQELAERARQLADRSDRLAAHEAALRHERAEWSRHVQQQRAELEAERFLLKAAKVAWKSKRALLATAATATTTSTTKPPAGSGATDQTAADHTPRPKRTSPPAAKPTTQRPSVPARAVPLAIDARRSHNVAPPAPQPPTVVPPPTARPRATRSDPTTRGPDPELARAAFNRGRALLERHQHQLAATTFHSAVQQDPGEPLYHYFLAIAQYEGGDRHAAEQNVRQAVQLERHRPIGNWGQIMLRHQGATRLWLERTRRSALRDSRDQTASD